MTQQIKEIATNTRAVLCHEYDDSTLKGLCLDCSRELARALARRGYDARLVTGTFAIDEPDPVHYDEWCEDDFNSQEEMDDAMHNPLHYWVAIGKTVIDITASQFNHELGNDADHMPEVFVGTYEESPRHRPRHTRKIKMEKTDNKPLTSDLKNAPYGKEAR